MNCIRVLLATTAILIGASSAYAQTTTTETLNFDDNLKPLGWNYFQVADSSLDNISVTNQRLEVREVNTAGGLVKAIDTSGITQIQVGYEANLSGNYSGQINGVALVVNPADITAGGFAAAMGGSAQNNQSQFFITPLASNGVIGVGIENYPVQPVTPPIWGTYYMLATFENGSVTENVTNAVTHALVATQTKAVPGFLLANMGGVILYANNTEGFAAWIDNVTVTTVTSASSGGGGGGVVSNIPEPETYATLLAGLGLIGVVSRRRTTKPIV